MHYSNKQLYLAIMFSCIFPFHYPSLNAPSRFLYSEFYLHSPNSVSQQSAFVFCILYSAFFLPFPLHSVFCILYFAILLSYQLLLRWWTWIFEFLYVDSGFWERACILRLCILRFCHPRQSWNGAQFGFGTYEMAHSQGDILEVSLSIDLNFTNKAR